MNPRARPVTLHIALTVLLLGAAAPAADAQTPTSLHWTGSVHVSGPLTVGPGETLIVSAGANVTGPGPILVQGRLVVAGTNAEPVLWRPSIVLDHGKDAQSSIEHAQFHDLYADEPCQVDLGRGALLVEGAQFVDVSRPICAAAGTVLELRNSTFLRNGFALYSEPLAVTEVSCAGPQGEEACPDASPEDNDNPHEPGAPGNCWPQERSGWSCRGWGGTAAVGIDSGATATLRDNRFEQNHVGVMAGLGDLTAVDNLFIDNDHGIEVWAQGPVSGAGEGEGSGDWGGGAEPPQPRTVVRGNRFVGHGDPDAVVPSPGLQSAVTVHGAMEGPVRPDPEQIRVVVEGNDFEDGAVGVHAEGWHPTLGVSDNRFVGNGVGFRGFTASAVLTNNTFEGGSWHVYLDGVTGHVELYGGTINPERVYVAGGQSIQTDWGLIIGTMSLASIVVLALAAINEVVRYALLFLFTPLTTRTRDQARLLQHPRRARIMNFIGNYPGTNLRAIGDALSIPRNPTTHHVQVLERAGLVRSRRHGFHRHVYPRGHDGAPLDPCGLILRLVESHPGIYQVQIRKQLDISPQLASHHVQKLRAAGLVTVERAGKSNRLFLGSNAS